jgi:hypothetical protein
MSISLSVGIEHAGCWIRKLHALTLAGAVGAPRPEQVPSMVVNAMVAEQARRTGPGLAHHISTPIASSISISSLGIQSGLSIISAILRATTSGRSSDFGQSFSSISTTRLMIILIEAA